MLELEEAHARILAAVPGPGAELVGLQEADGRVLLDRVVAPMDLPPFDNSAMDGYAVRAADLKAARRELPVRLRLQGRIVAGAACADPMGPGRCVRVFTGSPLPPGADAVIMQEDIQVSPESPGEVLALEPVRAGENVRWRGEDVKSGVMLAEEGSVLSPGGLSLLAAVGLAQVRVGRRPVVAVLATGSELKEPGQPLAPGQIYESNRVGLAALARRAGAIPQVFPLVPDVMASTRAALEEALETCDAVVTSGGVSVGEMDFVKSALAESGGELQFWKVAMKPGRPFVFGRRGGKLFFGLPGNPVSALVSFLLLVRPALLRWQGATEVSLPSFPGRLAEPLTNPGPRRHFVRIRLDGLGNVHAAGAQASHVLSSLGAADGLVDLPPRTALEPGTEVHVLSLG